MACASNLLICSVSLPSLYFFYTSILSVCCFEVTVTSVSLSPFMSPTDGVRVEKVRHDDDGHALAGGIAPTALFPESPPPSEVALRATAATRPAFSGAPLVVLFVYISI